MEGLEETVRKLADEMEIRNLIARVVAHSDGRGTMEEAMACWTEDGVWESAMNGTWRGHESFVDKYRSVGVDRQKLGLDPYRTPGYGRYHITSNTEVFLNGDTATARSKWLMATTMNGKATLHLAGTYDDTFQRTEAGWKISYRLVRHETDAPWFADLEPLSESTQ